MEQSYKKRPPCATANSPLGLADMREDLFYKSVNSLLFLYQTHFGEQHIVL